jgi:hypothetical protein
LIKAGTRLVGDTTVTGDGLTLVGAGTPDVAGIVASTSNANTRNVDVGLANSLIRGAGNAIGTAALNTGTAKVRTSYSDYDASDNVAFGGSIEEDHLTNVGDAQFADPANGDYRLRFGSPLVDKGDPDVAQGLDLEGSALVADGNGDGFARRDIGAFELQPAAPQPQPQGDTQAPVITKLRARQARVSYALSENARVVVKIQRRLAGKRARYRTIGKAAGKATQGANRLRLARRIRAKDARPGRYRAVIVATDAAGNHSKPKTATFRVSR